MSKQLIRLFRPLSDKECKQINDIVRRNGLKKGAFYLQAICEKIEREKIKENL